MTKFTLINSFRDFIFKINYYNEIILTLIFHNMIKNIIKLGDVKNIKCSLVKVIIQP